MSASVVRGVMRSTEVLTKLTLASIQSGQAGVPRPGHARHGVVRHGAVVGEVVAADDGERPGPGSPAGGEGQHQPAQRRRRVSAAGRQQRKVGGDVGRSAVELPVGAEPVGRFGDGQGDDGGGRSGNQLRQPLHVRAVHGLHDAADDGEGVAAVGAFHHA